MVNFKMQDEEKVIKQGKANRTNFFNSQGGELVLTNKRLVFVGHGKNIGEGTVSINIDEIMVYGKASTFVIFLPLPIPNAFKVVTQQGKKFKFTVGGRKKWIKEISQVMNS